MLKKIIKNLLSENQINYIQNYRMKKRCEKNKEILKSIEAKEAYINEIYSKIFGYKIDFQKEPETFNEKIQFRKLYTDDETNKLYALCADKYKVREYVAERIGEEYLIPLVLVADKLTLKDWEKLPNECVIKANHNSGPVQIILDKQNTNPKKIIDEINFQLEIDYGVLSLESYYSLIERKVIVEKLLKDEDGKIPKDYKIHCFRNKRGELKQIIQVDSDRLEKHEQDFYNEKFENIDLEAYKKNSKKALIKNKNLEKILIIADNLSREFDYARIDLYIVNEKIYFGEITFCPWSGFQKFNPSFWDKKLYEFLK